MSTFWDFCAPFYDIAEKTNDRAYGKMLKTVNAFVPQDATILEAAAGTGSISLAVAGKANRILCTDLSEKMLKLAERKAIKRGFQNIKIEIRSIYELGEPDNSFDVVIAGQVLYLIDEPEKAAAELRRVARSMVILPMSFTKNLRGMAKFGVDVYRFFGFNPKLEFSADDYAAFLPSIGFKNCEHIQINGKIPMSVAVWKKV
jgi:ubiquinone/menaquinone biosynthesis C-methylase UbiE